MESTTASSRSAPTPHLQRPLPRDGRAPTRGVVHVIERAGRFHRVSDYRHSAPFIPMLDRVVAALSTRDEHIRIPRARVISLDRISLVISATFVVRVIDPRAVAYSVDDPDQSVRIVALMALRAASSEFIARAPVDDPASLAEAARVRVHDAARKWGVQCSAVLIDTVRLQDPRTKGQETTEQMEQDPTRRRRNSLLAQHLLEENARRTQYASLAPRAPQGDVHPGWLVPFSGQEEIPPAVAAARAAIARNARLTKTARSGKSSAAPKRGRANVAVVTADEASKERGPSPLPMQEVHMEDDNLGRTRNVGKGPVVQPWVAERGLSGRENVPQYPYHVARDAAVIKISDVPVVDVARSTSRGLVLAHEGDGQGALKGREFEKQSDRSSSDDLQEADEENAHLAARGPSVKTVVETADADDGDGSDASEERFLRAKAKKSSTHVLENANAVEQSRSIKPQVAGNGAVVSRPSLGTERSDADRLGTDSNAFPGGLVANAESSPVGRHEGDMGYEDSVPSDVSIAMSRPVGKQERLTPQPMGSAISSQESLIVESMTKDKAGSDDETFRSARDDIGKTVDTVATYPEDEEDDKLVFGLSSRNAVSDEQTLPSAATAVKHQQTTGQSPPAAVDTKSSAVTRGGLIIGASGTSDRAPKIDMEPSAEHSTVKSSVPESYRLKEALREEETSAVLDTSDVMPPAHSIDFTPAAPPPSPPSFRAPLPAPASSTPLVAAPLPPSRSPPATLLPAPLSPPSRTVRPRASPPPAPPNSLVEAIPRLRIAHVEKPVSDKDAVKEKSPTPERTPSPVPQLTVAVQPVAPVVSESEASDVPKDEPETRVLESPAAIDSGSAPDSSPVTNSSEEDVRVHPEPTPQREHYFDARDAEDIAPLEAALPRRRSSRSHRSASRSAVRSARDIVKEVSEEEPVLAEMHAAELLRGERRSRRQRHYHDENEDDDIEIVAHKVKPVEEILEPIEEILEPVEELLPEEPREETREERRRRRQERRERRALRELKRQQIALEREQMRAAAAAAAEEEERSEDEDWRMRRRRKRYDEPPRTSEREEEDEDTDAEIETAGAREERWGSWSSEERNDDEAEEARSRTRAEYEREKEKKRRSSSSSSSRRRKTRDPTPAPSGSERERLEKEERPERSLRSEKFERSEGSRTRSSSSSRQREGRSSSSNSRSRSREKAEARLEEQIPKSSTSSSSKVKSSSSRSRSSSKDPERKRRSSDSNLSRSVASHRSSRSDSSKQSSSRRSSGERERSSSSKRRESSSGTKSSRSASSSSRREASSGRKKSSSEKRRKSELTVGTSYRPSKSAKHDSSTGLQSIYNHRLPQDSDSEVDLCIPWYCEGQSDREDESGEVMRCLHIASSEGRVRCSHKQCEQRRLHRRHLHRRARFVRIASEWSDADFASGRRY